MSPGCFTMFVALTDHARHQDCAGCELDLFPDFHLVLVPHVRRLEGVGLRLHLESDVDDVFEGLSFDMYAEPAAPAPVVAHFLRLDAGKSMVQPRSEGHVFPKGSTDSASEIVGDFAGEIVWQSLPALVWHSLPPLAQRQGAKIDAVKPGNVKSDTADVFEIEQPVRIVERLFSPDQNVRLHPRERHQPALDGGRLGHRHRG